MKKYLISEEGVAAPSVTPMRKTQDQHTTVVVMLQQLREEAWHKAMKYRFDPVLGQTHADYLATLNNLLEVVC